MNHDAANCFRTKVVAAAPAAKTKVKKEEPKKEMLEAAPAAPAAKTEEAPKKVEAKMAPAAKAALKK